MHKAHSITLIPNAKNTVIQCDCRLGRHSIRIRCCMSDMKFLLSFYNNVRNMICSLLICDQRNNDQMMIICVYLCNSIVLLFFYVVIDWNYFTKSIGSTIAYINQSIAMVNTISFKRNDRNSIPFFFLNWLIISILYACNLVIS